VVPDPAVVPEPAEPLAAELPVVALPELVPELPGASLVSPVAHAPSRLTARQLARPRLPGSRAIAHGRIQTSRPADELGRNTIIAIAESSARSPLKRRTRSRFPRVMSVTTL
jgi:hypothetical protein